MKKHLFLLLGMLLSVGAFAQTGGDAAPAHRIVFQLSSDDTLVHKALMRQLGNVKSASPTTQMEVVCHGPGLDMLLKDKTTVAKGLADMTAKGVVFVACEFTLRQRSLTKEALVKEAGTVESALLEIVKKQEAGWSYIKSGF
jgi:hypothetical protein